MTSEKLGDDGGTFAVALRIEPDPWSKTSGYASYRVTLNKDLSGNWEGEFNGTPVKGAAWAVVRPVVEAPASFVRPHLLVRAEELPALIGDPQSGPAWPDIAVALVKAKPDALVVIGDLVSDGLAPGKWNDTFVANAPTNLPWVAVIGNHDRRAPLFEQFGGLCWTREISGALLVGIDGGLDWSPGSDNAKWLEKTLAGATNRFKFVVSHYPAYSSRNHGKLAPDGRLLERPSRIAREQIVPILEKCGATAMFCGHDHGYERSELPSSLTAITTAGGGAGLYPKRDDRSQNPYSTLTVDKHHYSLLRTEGGKATFTAITADGTVIDTRTWTLGK